MHAHGLINMLATLCSIKQDRRNCFRVLGFLDFSLGNTSSNPTAKETGEDKQGKACV